MHCSIRYTFAGMALIVPLSLFAGKGGAQPQPATQPPGQAQPQSQTPTQPQPQPARQFHGVGGSITSVSSGSFVLTDRKGNSVTVRMTPATRLFTSRPAGLADLRTGDAVRIVAQKAQDGTLTARFVQDVASGPAAPQEHSGVRPGRSGMVMVSGNLTGAPAGGTLAVAIPNGQTTSVVVPSTARVSRLVPAARSDLAVGGRVMVQGTTNADGSVTASLIFVGARRGQ